MKIFRSGLGPSEISALLDRRYQPSPSVERTVRAILADVSKNGDRALIRLTRKFGGPILPLERLRVSGSEVEAARKSLDRKTREAIRASRKNVLAFARRSLRKTWFRKNAQGAVVGERFDAFDRVGVYIPGGTAPLVSTAIMTCALAQAAGVREIVAVTPPDISGNTHPALLAALGICGATEIHRVGGAQAIAALALGTPTIRPVNKIFGPGNAYVVEAKRQVFGPVAIDLLPGPSEALVIADAPARADWIAADLLAQCEHGQGSLGVLLTDSLRLLNAVARSIQRQAAQSARAYEVALALDQAVLARVSSMEEAVRLANAFAPEHVSIATRFPGRIAGKLTTAGAIFIGGLSPIAIGDFLAGPSHTLPTGGAAKSFSGLTSDQFQRRTSVLLFDEAALCASAPFIEEFARVEGLDAHGRSVAIRMAQNRRRAQSS